MWTVAGASVLSVLGISIAALLTAAGITGVALGIAAQGVLQDCFAAFVLVLEGQLRMGDLVEVAGHEGIVESSSWRTSRLRGDDGKVIFVPCGVVTAVTNKSMASSSR